MIRLARIPLGEVDFAVLDTFPDRTVFQSRPWLSFLAETQHADPVIAEVRDGDELLGWFTGATVRRFGLRVLGSPLAGWTTGYQGFNLPTGFERERLLEPLARFSAELGCRHVEVMDRALRPGPVGAAGWHATTLPGWELDLGQDAADLLAGTSMSCRWAIRKAARNGLAAREAPAEGFAATFHRLVSDAFDRRGAEVTYPKQRVQALIDHLHPTGQLLLLEVREREGDGPVVGAGLFPGSQQFAYYWGGASTAESRPNRPNEAMLWAAITSWRDRGARAFDFGGGGEFKSKFGGRPIEVAWARSSRPAGLEHLRGLAGRIARRGARRGG